MSAWLLIACLVVPLAGGLAMLCSRGRMLEGWVLLTPPLLFAAVVAVHAAFTAGRRVSWTWFEPVTALPIAFEVEPLGLLFALVASLLWIPTSLYAIGYARGHDLQHRARFYACFAGALACAMGIAFSANLLTLFICYEMLTLVTYPLVTHAGSPKALQAGRSYLGYLLGTSLGLQLFAIVWLWTLAGRLDFSVGGILPADTPDTTVLALFLLFLFGTGKAALMPIHRWLPQAMVAPTPVSALLHAVAVVKAGAFVILKVSAMVIGSERLGGTLASSLGVLLACFTIVAASLVALGRDNLKERLAYSTVAQLAYIVLGAALAVPSGLFGGAMHVAMHAFAKITLFFCAGAIVFAAGATRVSELDGMGRRQPLIMAAFLIGSLGIIGLPPGGGTWSKWLLMQATLESGYWVATVALALSSLLSIYYLLTIPLRAFLLAPAPGARTADGAVPAGCRITIAATALGTVALFFLPGPLHALLAG